ncbi:DUF4331 domain-containing protein [Flavobacterium jejuense]|uniref:DUF4331 domain-containing protein n=1 Tax=Flavobacterium jejuense TaxID=1544455 RepID=A0ABX0INR0_9FLAO|nr:DUF4331 domain-containing protein [Flavobacterium jejuense]
MKSIQYKRLFASLIIASFIVGCSDDDSVSYEQPLDFSGTYTQQDQMGRPAINTVFVSSANKDAFNTTTPSSMNASFQSAFENQLLALNPNYTTNLLGLDAPSFTGVLATDVLGVSTTGTTTFYDGNNVLTGRALADDVIDVELILIFGGPTNADNVGLTSDHVDANDKAFLSSFPYLASPW